MSYHNNNIPGNSQSKRNAQGQTAPRGYHYMPDGTLMSDAEHARLYGASPESSTPPVSSTSSTGCGIIGMSPQWTPGMLLSSPIYWPNLAATAGPGTVLFDMTTWILSSGISAPVSINEVARYGNKIWQCVSYSLNNNVQGWVQKIIELDFDDSIPSASFSRLIPLQNNNLLDGFGGTANYFASATSINSTTIILARRCVDCLVYKNDIIKFDVSGSTAVETILFATSNQVMDLAYVPSSNTLVAIESALVQPFGYQAAHYTMTGALLGTVPIVATTGIFCHNGNVIIPGNGALDLASMTLDTSPSYISYAMELNVDAASDPECCDGSLGIPGCTDPTAQNYDPTATVDDGSCIATVYGCTDPVALNYYAGAQVDDGSCCYTSLVYDPTCNCAVCAGAGCTDPLALNYDPLATPDDGSCVYPPPVNPCKELWTINPTLVQSCCEWCKENALIPGGLYGPPPPGCFDWHCDCCKPPMIKNLDLDLSDIPAAGERRAFTITGEGDGEVEFELRVRDKDTGKYYNFVTNLFQTEETSLEDTIK